MQFNLWYLALAWIVVYTAFSLVLSQTNRVPDYITAQGPITLIHTTWGRDAIDSLAKRYSRFWPVWGVAGVALFFGGLVLGTGLLLFSALQVINQPSSAEIAKEPQNLLVIPGVNEYLPLEAAPALVAALLIAMVIHELGHAIYCRLGDIDIESTGVALFALIPIGAFVEPNEESQENATRWNRIQMVSAGIMNNLAATVVAMLVLVLVVPMIISPAPGVAIGGVLPGTPADAGGVESGDQLVSVNGTSIADTEEFSRQLKEIETSKVRVTTSEGQTYTINRQVFITAAYQSASVSPGDAIASVNGDPVQTKSQFTQAVQTAENPLVNLTTSTGETFEYVAGARVTVSDESSLSQFASSSGQLVITNVGETSVRSASELSTALSERKDGETISVTGYQETESGYEKFVSEYTISKNNKEIAATRGFGGLSVSDVGVQFYPTERYLGLLTAGNISIFASLALIVFLPFATVGGLPYNFAGFTPDIINFYQVAGPLEPVSSIVFFGVSLTFWTVWINVNLALFNCLPTFALDGGYYMRYGFEEVAARLGYANPKQASKNYARACAGLILIGMVLIVVLPYFFG